MAKSASSILKQLGDRSTTTRTSKRVMTFALLTVFLAQFSAMSIAMDKPTTPVSAFSLAAKSHSLLDQWYDSLLLEQSVVPEVGKFNRNNSHSLASTQISDESLWLRLEKHGVLETPTNEAVDKELDILVENKFWTTRNLNDAGPYLQYVLSRLEARNLPVELALLPVIESSYNPAARSHLNAVGLWQLVPSTAKSLGLTINQWTDERKDIKKSTKAALDYLEKMHEGFNSWPLTVAAYNAGPSRIRARVKKVGKDDFEIWDVSLPNETRRYVAKFFALNEMIRRADDLDVELPVIPHNPVFTEVQVEKQISLTTAAELAELPVEHLAKLNHDLLKSATPPDGPHTVVVPLDAKETFQTNLDRAIESSVELFRPTVYHTVAYGESLSVIAAQYGLTVSEIKRLNQLESTKIRSGQKIQLAVTTPKKKTADILPAVAAKETTTKDLSILVPNEMASKVNEPEYKVREGDTLSEIASMYGVRRALIAETNNINNDDMLRAGKTLVIPARFIPEGDDTLKYTVKYGDTLSEIAELFTVPLIEIKRLNPPLAEAKTILPGQKVFIPKSAY